MPSFMRRYPDICLGDHWSVVIYSLILQTNSSESLALVTVLFLRCIAISWYLRMNEGIEVSHQSIYNIIHNDTTGKLAEHTRHKMKYRHRPKGGHLPIKDRVSIHERSKEVDGKRFGDFEMDLIVDPAQHAILTIVEKSTNMLLMQKLPF